MGLGLVIGDVSLQVLVSYSVEVFDKAVRVELRWFELVVNDFRLCWDYGLCWGWEWHL